MRGINAKQHVRERMRVFVSRQAHYVVPREHMLGDTSVEQMQLRVTRRHYCDVFAVQILDHFKLDNGHECVETAIFVADTYIGTRPTLLLRDSADADFETAKMVCAAALMIASKAVCQHWVTAAQAVSAMVTTADKSTEAFSQAVSKTRALSLEILLAIEFKCAILPTVPVAIDHLVVLLDCLAVTSRAKRRWYACRSHVEVWTYTPAVLAAAALCGAAASGARPALREEAAPLCASTSDTIRDAEALLTSIAVSRYQVSQPTADADAQTAVSTHRRAVAPP